MYPSTRLHADTDQAGVFEFEAVEVPSRRAVVALPHGIPNVINHTNKHGSVTHGMNVIFLLLTTQCVAAMAAKPGPDTAWPQRAQSTRNQNK
eukprot:2193897-Rhodomonas_salina.1